MSITNGYCTLDQLRKHMGYQTLETGDDAKLELAVGAASRQIDGHCGRRFWQDGTVVAREFYADDPRCLDVAGVDGDISTVTGLIVKIDQDGDGTFETTLTIATDFILKPTNAADRVPVRPYTEVWLADNYYWPRLANGRPGVQITAKFGWPAVPDDVTEACLIQAALIFESKDAVLGSYALGESTARTMKAALHPLASALVDDYALPAVG